MVSDKSTDGIIPTQGDNRIVIYKGRLAFARIDSHPWESNSVRRWNHVSPNFVLIRKTKISSQKI